MVFIWEYLFLSCYLRLRGKIDLAIFKTRPLFKASSSSSFVSLSTMSVAKGFTLMTFSLPHHIFPFQFPSFPSSSINLSLPLFHPRVPSHLWSVHLRCLIFSSNNNNKTNTDAEPALGPESAPLPLRRNGCFRINSVGTKPKNKIDLGLYLCNGPERSPASCLWRQKTEEEMVCKTICAFISFILIKRKQI